MNNNFSVFFRYLEKESIHIDKSEFEFQIQSHPNYPSLLAVSDTLSFFNVDNLCVKIDSEHIRLLPNRFVVLINENLSDSRFCLIERENGNFFLFENKKRVLIIEEKLQKDWGEIVLLIENNNLEDSAKKNKNNYNWSLILIVLILFLGVLYNSNALSQTSLFFIFPFLGIFLSIAILKDLFGVESKLVNDFCNIATSTSCNSVVNSDKWKVFRSLSFSDLGIVFFSSQLISLFLAILNHKILDFFIMQKTILLLSLPVILTSIYYQKFVEKKWCPICLFIISIIFGEIVFIVFVDNSSFYFPLHEFLLFGFLFVFILVIWNQLKILLLRQKQLKESFFKSIRFERNYKNFRNNLLKQRKLTFPEVPLVLGNIESKGVITLISNPFCAHCKGAHEIIESIIERHGNDIQVQIILKTNIESESEESKKFFRRLMMIYVQKGKIAFEESLKVWFDKKNIKEWFDLYPGDSPLEFDEMFNVQYGWCQENDYNFTPAIFINGYEYPQTYERELLLFFVKDFIEDEF